MKQSPDFPDLTAWYGGARGKQPRFARSFRALYEYKFPKEAEVGKSGKNAIPRNVSVDERPDR